MILSNIENNIVTFTINVSDRPMNVMSENFLHSLEEIIEKFFHKDASYSGYIFTSSRKEFLAGADLDLLKEIKTTGQSLALTRRLHRCFRLIEKSNRPVVAAVNGTALGGGLELALACNHIIVINDEKIKLGLPEVTLGVLPGGGGTQRLPRMIGFEAAIPLLTQGTSLAPEKALSMGIINELAENASDMIKKAHSFIAKNPDVKKPWDGDKFKLPGSPVQSPTGYRFFPGSAAMLMDKTWLNYPAPQNIIKSVYEGLQLPFDTALEIEQKFFAELVISPIAKNMIKTMFFAMNECKSGKRRPKLPPTDVKKLGIIGAGLMGSAIAYVSAKAKINVVLLDVDKTTAERGKEYTRQKGREDLLGFITPTDDFKLLADCDLIIEAVKENPEIKKSVIEKADSYISDKCIFSSNTSTLPITGLAVHTNRKMNFIGLHFFSPAEKMPLVEIIMGKETSQDALALVMDFVTKIGKVPVVVNDSPGFYTTRVFNSYIQEGIEAYCEGISPVLIENAALAAGMAVGPLAVSDEVGINLIYDVMKNLPQSKVKKLITDFYTAGRFGRKSGKGFYEYPENQKKHLAKDLSTIVPTTLEITLDELKLRFLTIQALESYRCLEEKILMSSSEGDVGSILGWGFPAYTGGTLSYIEFRGKKQFIEDCEYFEKKVGPRFKAPPSLN